MKLIKPKKLQKGDLVAIVSPSSSIKNFPRRLKRGITELESLGLRVIVADNALNSQGHNAGTPQERADDINNCFKNPEIKAIICSTGGWTANSVLPLLDYDLIKNNPKIFCGFSDITALNLAIYKKTNMVTFNGPTILPSFGEHDGLSDFTKEYFKKILFNADAPMILDYPNEFTDELLWWETEDDRSRIYKKASKPYYVSEGYAEGKLIGGNLITLCILGGTEYFPIFDNSIIFLEEEGESTSSVERRLFYLEQLGVFKKIKGLIFGRPSNFKINSEDRLLKTILAEFGKKYDVPIIVDVDCGHTAPIYTFPIGVKVTLNSKKNLILIDENGVE